MKTVDILYALSKKFAKNKYDDKNAVFLPSMNKKSKLIRRNYESGLDRLWKAEQLAPYLGIQDGFSGNGESLSEISKIKLRAEKIVEFHKSFKSEKQKKAVHEILSLIVHGEAYAMYTSSTLLTQVKSTEAKLALATQTIEEAKHFYVLRSITEVLYGDIRPLKPWTRILFDRIANQEGENKLFGMNILLENFALVIFEELGKYPVLSDVVGDFHADESRHCGLPMNYAEEGWIPKSQRSIKNRLIRTYVLSPALGVVSEYFKDFYRMGLNPIEVFERFVNKTIDLSDRSDMPLLVDGKYMKPLVGYGFSYLKKKFN